MLQWNHMFTGTVSCGNEVIAPKCSLCPKINDRGENDWCGGNCARNELTGICEKKGIVS